MHLSEWYQLKSSIIGRPHHFQGYKDCIHIYSICFPLIQAEHLTSCYWGGTSNATDRHDPSLPYLEQYRIDFEQFKGMFALLFPWACGTHSDVLAARLFRLLDENGDSLINFREFVSGLSKETTAKACIKVFPSPLNVKPVAWYTTLHMRRLHF